MNHRVLLAWISALIVLGGLACQKETAVSSNPTPQSTAIPISEPTAIPDPTPVPLGLDFLAIRKNREIMQPEQIYKYGRDLAGKEVGGWIGYFHAAIESEQAGKSRVVVDMDKNAGGLPDVILEDIPTETAQRFQTRQEINFSGTIQGYVDIPECYFLLSLSDAKIFGY